MEVKDVRTVRDRVELAGLFFGRCIELGVAKGEFSETILKNPNVSVLFSVDRWSDHHDENEYREAKARLAAYGNRSVIVRSSFEEALETGLFKPQSFDCIYVDGYAHTGQEGGQTLRDWFAIVKPGGIFGGHDYHSRWTPTIEAVDQFVKDNHLMLNVTQSNDEFNSWWVIKP